MSNQTARIAIIAADFNKEIVGTMIEEAKAEATETHMDVIDVVSVPGCYEVPIIAEQKLRLREIDLLVVLGFIERGETLHGEVMGHVVHRALIDLQLKHGKPIGLGIIGPGATLEQAAVRKADYARAAVRAAAQAWKLVSQISQAPAEVPAQE
jgi:6,7-dimethyl-8-ribityllumazine synthase